MSIDELFSFYDDFGYLGILLISFLGSIIVFVPIPYFPVLITAAFNDNLDPTLISLSSAIGAVIAKLVIFYASYYGRNMLSSKIKGKMLPLQRLLGRYGAIGAFIAAISPIPDDIVYIPLGLAKYNPWKFAIATFLGKFAFNEIFVLGAIYFGKPFVNNLMSNSTNLDYLLVVTIVSIAVLGVIIYFALKIDWTKIIGHWFPWTLDKDQEEEKK
ncbi:MAG TPA: VTT domain-containing protein [Nitrososphaeraceae archaeon]|nr:VTT domain-containing protein [Nitrososphaeraceae archaeon]